TTKIPQTMIQGNQENRATVYDNKIIDYINFILRSSDFESCEPQQVVQLRQTIANLVISLIEENSPEALVIAREVKDTLDKGALYRAMSECYEAQQRTGKDGGFLVRLFKKEENRELKEAMCEVGFTFYVILARLYDIDPAMGKKGESIAKLSSEKLVM
uniref:MIF4G domain-containing protein n=1 Tax=Macrostomum lignano TaxID=282301 RepID=A0A1I8HYC3_9PLAT